jgi:hypothetical protein
MSGPAVGQSDVKSAGSVLSMKFTFHSNFTVRIDDDKNKKSPTKLTLQGEVVLVVMNDNTKADRGNTGKGQRILIVVLLSG